MLSDLDFLNSIPPSAPPTSATATADPAPLPFLPLDHPLHAELAPLLESLTLAQGGDSLDDDSVEALMKQLDNAEGAADGIEDKLDSLLRSLDAMLGSMGGAESEPDAQTEKEEDKAKQCLTDSESKSKSKSEDVLDEKA